MVIANNNSVILVKNSLKDLENEPKEVNVVRTTDSDPWINWGDENLLPQDIIKQVNQDEVVFRSNEFNKATHYGLGLSYVREMRVKDGIELDYSAIPEVDDFMEAIDAQRLFLEFIEDYETLGNIFPSMVLNKNRTKIAAMFRKQTAWSRWGKQDKAARVVKQVFINSDWENYNKDMTETIDVLNQNFPLDDLKARKTGYEFIYRQRPIAAGRYYYDMANVEVLMNAGTFELRDIVRGFYKSRLKNNLGAAYMIEVTEQYLKMRVGSTNSEKLKTDAQFFRNTLLEIKKEVDDWLSGPNNQGKTVIAAKFKEQLKTGYEYVPGITITALDTKLNVDGLLSSVQQVIAQNFLAMGVDPSNIGLSNMKDGMNSGSEKKNAFYNTQATMAIDRVTTLAPFYFAAKFNGITSRYKGFKFIVNDAPIIPHGNSTQNAS